MAVRADPAESDDRNPQGAHIGPGSYTRARPVSFEEPLFDVWVMKSGSTASYEAHISPNPTYTLS